MSLIRLPSGRFLVIDTVPLTDTLKHELDTLTENGTLIEAVIATHPFHTLSFPMFYDAYPDVEYYGTPRHLLKQQEIAWTGNIMENLSKWEPEVHMRIPDGCEFIAPVPEASNHLSCVWVYSPEARTIHVDDCIMYFKTTGLLGALTKLAGKAGTFDFHLSFGGPGICEDAESPMLFRDWVQNVIDDWDFDNACCAHIGNKIGGAKELLVRCLEDNEKNFEKMTKKERKKKTVRIVWIILKAMTNGVKKMKSENLMSKETNVDNIQIFTVLLENRIRIVL